MNAVCVSGFVSRPVLNGGNVLRFVVVAKHGYSRKKGERLSEFVPCCLFNPSQKLKDLLLGEKVFLELRGRVSSSRYEKDGETRYSTQVVVDPASLNFVR